MNIQEMRDNAFKLTDKIIEKVGPRLAGSNASLEASEILKDEMSTFADKVVLEQFKVHTGAFLGWIKILVISYLLGVILLWLGLPIVSLIFVIGSLLILVLQFFMYKPVIDRFYKAKDGQNVIGTIEPLNEPTKQIIVSGHHDSANVFNFFIHQPKLYNFRVTGGIALVISMLPVSVLLLFDIGVVGLILKIIVSVGFLLIGQMWFFASKKASPGAGDNLIASSLAIEVGRYFSKNRLQNTRIIIASFDAEEEGLRGARAYARKHEEDLNIIPTYLLNVDCPYHLKDLFALTSDINGFVMLSETLAKDLEKIAKDKEYPFEYKPIAFLTGGTDAAELAKVGVYATTLMAMPWDNNNRSSVYHTPNDTSDAVEKEAIDAIIDIFIEYINKRDQK